MRNFNKSLLLVLLLVPVVALQAQYFPPAGATWATVPPEKAGFSKTALQEAVDFALAHEYSGPRDLRLAILKAFAHEPYHEILGPVKERGGPAGMILKNGYLVTSWGDTKRVDMTFSVTKSYLSTVAGLAIGAGLITSVDDPVADYVWDGTFEGEHNSKITWAHLLNQSSDWSGSLFGMPDWADRPPRQGDIDDWKYRKLHEPGTYFKYNDVRVNVLAYALLQVWRQPLPVVLREKIMQPIGASTTWRWMGYDNAWVTLDGQRLQSVTGGGHSGGGLFISTEDHARFGLLFLNVGKWNGRQLIPAHWVRAVQQPSPANPSYGYMWWLNRGPRKWPGVDNERIYYAAGFGGNYIIIDPEHDMVVVLRWLEPARLGEFMAKLYAAIK